MMILKKMLLLTGMILMTNTCFGNIVVNEVMSNEPGSQVSLEWVELYNNSDSTKSLLFYSIKIGSLEATLQGISLGPYKYYVICRRLYDSATSPGFESVWGDGSGVWGDVPSENFQAYRIADLALPNDSGTVVLEYASIVKSTFHWSEVGEDGVSWERFTPTSPTIGNAIDSRGGTPGRLNSITPRQYDLALLSTTVKPGPGGAAIFSFEIANLGLSPISGATISCYYDSDKDSVVADSDLVAVIDFSAINLGDTIEIVDTLELKGIYPWMLLQLTSDDRNENNTRAITAPGRNFPPVVLSEFISNPQSPLTSEWVELRNGAGTAINLKGWKLGDSLMLYPLTADDLVLDSGGYLVVCKDSSGFKALYGNAVGSLHEMSGWAALNNDHDKIRLADSYGFAADSFSYTTVYEDNFSWGRGEGIDQERWGRSREAGGTPGAPNEIYFQPSASTIKIDIDPNPFSPSRDGPAKISFSVPPGDNLAMRIYDLEGRIVRTLLDGLPAVDGTIEWNGMSDGGRPVRVGIYILYVEVFGRDQYKRTIVVAP